MRIRPHYLLGAIFTIDLTSPLFQKSRPETVPILAHFGLPNYTKVNSKDMDNLRRRSDVEVSWIKGRCVQIFGRSTVVYGWRLKKYRISVSKPEGSRQHALKNIEGDPDVTGNVKNRPNK